MQCAWPPCPSAQYRVSPQPCGEKECPPSRVASNTVQPPGSVQMGSPTMEHRWLMQWKPRLSMYLRRNATNAGSMVGWLALCGLAQVCVSR